MKIEGPKSLYNYIARPSVGMLLLIIAGLIAYSGTLDQPFHYDDIGNIVENPYIRDITNIPRFFVEIKGPPIAVRPLASATFALNYSLSELDTTSYHVLNIALHILNGLLLYILVLKCARRFDLDGQKGNIVALVAALLFIAHPIQTETVSYIVTRSMLLAAFFYFLGFIVFLQAIESRKSGWPYALAICVISLLGMSSREDFVTFPLMLLVFDYMFISEGSFSKVFKNKMLHIPAWLGLFYLAFLVMSHSYNKSGFGIDDITPYEYFITQGRVHWTYLRMLLLPIGQNVDYDYPVSASLLEPRTLIAFLGYLGIWTAGAGLVRKRPAISFLILWFMITLTPASSIVPLADVIFEHRLYIASAGFFVLSALLISRMHNRSALVAVMIMLFLALTVSTYSRNVVWETRVSLWEDSVRKSPQKSRPHFNLGTNYKSMGHTDLAIKELNRALELRPVYPEADYNLGGAYLVRNQVDLAINHYRNAIKDEPGYYQAHNNLSVALRVKGLYDESIQEAARVLEIKPGYVNAINSLALGYLLKGEAALAVEYLNKSIRLDPNRSVSYESLAAAYRKLGKDDLARDAFMKAQELKQRGK